MTEYKLISIRENETVKVLVKSYENESLIW